jgi:hypothetical protein
VFFWIFPLLSQLYFLIALITVFKSFFLLYFCSFFYYNFSCFSFSADFLLSWRFFTMPLPSPAASYHILEGRRKSMRCLVNWLLHSYFTSFYSQGRVFCPTELCIKKRKNSQKETIKYCDNGGNLQPTGNTVSAVVLFGSFSPFSYYLQYRTALPFSFS